MNNNQQAKHQENGLALALLQRFRVMTRFKKQLGCPARIAGTATGITHTVVRRYPKLGQVPAGNNVFIILRWHSNIINNYFFRSQLINLPICGSDAVCMYVSNANAHMDADSGWLIKTDRTVVDEYDLDSRTSGGLRRNILV